MCPAKTHIRLASALSDQSSLCAQWVAKDPVFLHADSEDSDQPRLSLCLAHRPFCCFYHAAAHILNLRNAAVAVLRSCQTF